MSKLIMGRRSGQPSTTCDWLASVAAVGVFAAAQLRESWTWPGGRWLGVACLLLALPLFILPFLHLGRHGGAPDGSSYVHTTRVADRGVYALVRHPQYLGYCLLVTGLMLLNPNPGTLTLSLLAVAGFVLQAAAEERYLVRTRGEAYVAYRERVPSFDLVRGLWRWWKRRQAGS